LDIIAAMFTKTLRPQTIGLQIGDPIPANAVLKRTHSDSGNHVLIPGQPGRDWDSISKLPGVPKAVWFAQSYIPTLLKLGEWRTFIIGGSIAYTIHSVYNAAKSTWSWELTDSYYSLAELR